MEDPLKGQMLISEPFLPDATFHRSVILITGDDEGHTGFVLNRDTQVVLSEVLSIENSDHFKIGIGGPVAPDTLHFLHCRPDLIEEGEEVADGIYWGGNFEQVKEQIRAGVINEHEIRFFLGYSGWSPEQLSEEMEFESWFVTGAAKELVFHIESEQLWQECLKRMGGKFELLINSPQNPQWN